MAPSRRRPSPGPGGAARAFRQATGRRGEDLAAAWYQAQGYQVLARNWRCQAGEIDLIARRGRQIVFCEVKTRTTSAFGSPAEAVTPRKQAQVRRVARAWLAEGGAGGSALRFDVAAVLAGRVEVLEGAF